jgi:hypothetical protein
MEAAEGMQPTLTLVSVPVLLVAEGQTFVSVG